MPNELDRVTAPWDWQEVATLNAYQFSAAFHPFTCANSSSHGGGRLHATPDGWECPDCDYRQSWAHAFMADIRSWPQPVRLRATAHREEGWWVIEVHGVGVTQERVGARPQRMAKDLVVCALDVKPDQFAVDITFVASRQEAADY